MHRFFIPPEWFSGDKVTLDGEVARQISHVLRLKTSEHITLLDNTGWEYEAHIDRIESTQVFCNVITKQLGTAEPDITVNLYQALLKADKMEYVLQKCVELGVKNFVPFSSDRTVVKEPSQSKIERWQNIIREAAEQSGRSVLPVLHPAISFPEACKMGRQPSLLFWEKERIIKFAETLKREPFNTSRTINIFVGPEGGFSEPEIAAARECGIITVGLGRRILRAETAGLVAISALMYERGELS